MKSPVGIAAKGKWKSILKELAGINEKVLDGRHHPCPVTGEGENRFRFSDRNGTGSYFCACSDGKGDGFDFLKCCKNWDFAEAAKEVEGVVGALPVTSKPEKSEEIILRDLRTLKRSILPDDVIVRRYLAARGLGEMPELPRVLKHAFSDYAIRQLSAKKLHAMLALVHNPQGKVVTFHLTYLQDDGLDRVRHDRAKVVATPHGEMRGSAVRLAPITGRRLGVGEGIESSLSAGILFDVPTWATLNAQNMEQFVWPDDLDELLVFGDNDATTFTGQAAAYKLAHRAAVSKRKVPKVTVHLPPPGEDWNDVLKRRRAEERGEITDGN
jgi:putative DNA primase/helicase